MIARQDYKTTPRLIHNIFQAEEIIRQELDKKETVKLWCLLGDATDNVEYYEKAWNLSNKKSARAQKHWGLYFFHRKQVFIIFYQPLYNINKFRLKFGRI